MFPIALTADEGSGNQGGPRGVASTLPPAPLDDARYLFKTEVPEHPLDVILGRPSDVSVTASVLAYSDLETMIQYGRRGQDAMRTTAVYPLKANEPAEIAMSGLEADSEYSYRLSTRKKEEPWTAEPERRFHTQRRSGGSFTFTIQADSHLDYNTEPQLYLRTLANVAADTPDFHIDLGDTFMTDKHRGRETAAAQYLAQRYYFGQIAHSIPLFLVLGNHDGEAGRWLDGRSDNMAVWANTWRKRYFPNPLPDRFYTGDLSSDAQAGLLEDYYAWEWGDALFVVLDPFWFTKAQRGNDDNWVRTLGHDQYGWLISTLKNSRAKFRFVFLHHLVGGLGKDARGGAEAAPYFEWGGQNPDGTGGFGVKRPGWPAPIHKILVDNHVNIVFHGHDHLFAKQECDGIVYQAVPQPGYPRYDNLRSAGEYGYKQGTFLGSSGHLRVRVDSGKATVEYVRAFLPADENGSRQNDTVAFQYEISPR